MEIAEAYEELNQFCTEKLKGIDYHMILVISKPTPAGPPIPTVSR